MIVRDPVEEGVRAGMPHHAVLHAPARNWPAARTSSPAARGACTTCAEYWLSFICPAQRCFSSAIISSARKLRSLASLRSCTPQAAKLSSSSRIEIAGLEHLDQLGQLELLVGRAIDHARHGSASGAISSAKKRSQGLARGGADLRMRIAFGHAPQVRQRRLGVEREQLAHHVPARVEMRAGQRLHDQRHRILALHRAEQGNHHLDARRIPRRCCSRRRRRGSRCHIRRRAAPPPAGPSHGNRACPRAACSMTKLWQRPSSTISSPSAIVPAIDEAALARLRADEIVSDRRRFPEGQRRTAGLHEAEQAGDAR